MSEAPAQGKRLPPPPRRPHLYSGSPQNPWCSRCHGHIAQLPRECRGADPGALELGE